MKTHPPLCPCPLCLRSELHAALDRERALEWAMACLADALKRGVPLTDEEEARVRAARAPRVRGAGSTYEFVGGAPQGAPATPPAQEKTIERGPSFVPDPVSG
jgi:hypothetical protein